ncbi:MAG: SAM-dependent chlorinase/fluorinase, partial [Gemmatimonas sp.]
MQTITLLTDFGTADGYVAEMKGVLVSGAPDAVVMDMSHDIPPQDVEAARLVLARYWRRFPLGTIHIVVVDPGVGTSRAALAVASGGQFLLGPDNGVLSPALFALDAEIVSLPIPLNAAHTFHGRDVFAPVAASLAIGVPLHGLGDSVTDVVRKRTPEARRRGDGSTVGEVITIDRFGNAVTNLVTRTGGFILAGGHLLAIAHTYSDVQESQPIAIVGSTGFVEIAIRNGHAANRLQLRRGDEIVLQKN